MEGSVVTTDAQVRRLMEQMSKNRRIGVAAIRSGMDRKTARKYVKEGRMPSQMKADHGWRTRSDPFARVWESDILPRLRDAPELEAKALFEDLLRRRPGEFDPGQVRTLQRKVKQWRAAEGPAKEVFFPQNHRPGEAAQTDFTSTNELGVTIGSVSFSHLLCHVVLPYSNWEWVTVCQSESLAALRRGTQAAFFQLGCVPKFHQTDNSTAATHDLSDGKRGFNADYTALMSHLGMTPRTTEVGEKEQNGDVESLHGALKRRLKQHLALRGSRDFESVAQYETWLQGICQLANQTRMSRIREELAVMRPLAVERLPEYSETEVRVSEWSTIRIKNNSYSVPSRLIGEWLRARVYDDRLEVYYAGRLQLSVGRLLGESKHRIDYRHIIWSLVRKPGAFERYRYRDELFPTMAFRRAYDALCAKLSGRRADIDYLRILHLAAATMEHDVEAAVVLLLDEGQVPTFEAVKALVQPDAIEVPALSSLQADLSAYDELLSLGEVAS